MAAWLGGFTKSPCAVSLLLVLLGVASAAGQAITEISVPAGAGPAGITAGPDGNIWFTEYRIDSNKIARITTDGVITEFRIPADFAHPLTITAGPDGNLWFTENRGLNQIGRVTTSGEIREFPIGGVVNPYGIATGPDGALWFTEEWGNHIGRITTSGSITRFLLPPCEGCNTPGSKSGPGGIVLGPDGALWFTEQYANKIGRITTSGAITEFKIPTPDSYPNCSRGGQCGPIFIAAGPDGALWFGESSENKIGRITTSGEITEFPIPTPGSEPYGIVAGLDGSLYFAERRGHKIGRITTSGAITEFPTPTPFSSPQGIALGPEGAIWFTEFEADKIGRLSVPPQGPVDRFPPVQTAPRTDKPRVLAPRN